MEEIYPPPRFPSLMPNVEEPPVPGFWGRLPDYGVHPWVSDIAARCLARRETMDASILSRMREAFRRFTGDAPDMPRIAETISSLGYSVEVSKRCLHVETDDGTVNVFLGEPDAVSGRTVALGDWNVHEEEGAEYYPMFAAGMFTCLDPGRRYEFRQKRLEYHWPDSSLPGR